MVGGRPRIAGRRNARAQLTGYTVVTRESEWDDESRAWELGYTDWLNNRCDCGGQIDDVMDPESVWLVDHKVCQRCRALSKVQRDQAEDDERAEKSGHKRFPGARKWTAERVYPRMP